MKSATIVFLHSVSLNASTNGVISSSESPQSPQSLAPHSQMGSRCYTQIMNCKTVNATSQTWTKSTIFEIRTTKKRKLWKEHYFSRVRIWFLLECKDSLIPASRDKQLHFIQDLYGAEINIDTAHTGSVACPIRFQVTFFMARTALNGTFPNLV
jgi:hypothetical protein